MPSCASLAALKFLFSTVVLNDKHGKTILQDTWEIISNTSDKTWHGVGNMQLRDLCHTNKHGSTKVLVLKCSVLYVIHDNKNLQTNSNLNQNENKCDKTWHGVGNMQCTTYE